MSVSPFVTIHSVLLLVPDTFRLSNPSFAAHVFVAGIYPWRKYRTLKPRLISRYFQSVAILLPRNPGQIPRTNLICAPYRYLLRPESVVLKVSTQGPLVFKPTMWAMVGVSIHESAYLSVLMPPLDESHSHPMCDHLSRCMFQQFLHDMMLSSSNPLRK